MDLNQFESCLVCGERNLQALKGYEKDKLMRCKKCRFVFCQQKPTVEELTTHYLQYPEERSLSEITISRYHALLDIFEKYRKTNNIIDVGSGSGFFLIEAKKRNWNVYGTEFRKEAISNCEQHGIKMTQSPLNFNYYPEGHFDIVTSFEVIEHINNPIEEIGHFNKIVRSGGVVYITTPNFDSISRRLLGAKWNVIQYPEHLCYYTKSTLSRLFRAAGFKPLKVTTTGVSLTRMKDSLGIIASQSAVETPTVNLDESIRKMTEERVAFRLLKRLVNYFLNLFKVGDAMQAFYQKT